MLVFTLASVSAAVFAVCVVLNWVLRRRVLSSNGKAVLVTGCDRGFGHMVAGRLSALGFRVFAGCLDAEGEGAQKLRRLTSPNICVIPLDVTDERQVADARDVVEAQVEGQGLWAVVNNSGVATFAEAEWCSMAQYRAVMNINWLGTVTVTKTFLPLVRAARGRVVNVASLAGRVALPGFTSYSSSKFAVVGFSDSLRREMFKFGVKVITIEPSLYRTALSDVDTLTRQNHQMWAETSQEVRHHYGDVYLRVFLANLARMLRHCSPRVHEVVDDVTHAVTSVHPYSRYVPGLLANQLPTDFFSATPNRFQDWVLDWIFRVPASPAAMALD
ncbi:short-chain dehydrogenase/reductase family 9C member 7-like [Babylonia areolata]|uniref:short-chain dehydrogenase/reductase family 9C member 7-like n=1 Tax=Babylonia areolata TaxID=304850 RepID=UPI003FCFDD74